MLIGTWAISVHVLTRDVSEFVYTMTLVTLSLNVRFRTATLRKRVGRQLLAYSPKTYTVTIWRRIEYPVRLQRTRDQHPLTDCVKEIITLVCKKCAFVRSEAL